MLQKTKSKHYNLIKYALLIPMVFGMLIYTSTEVRAQQKVEKQEQVVDQELTDEELIEKYYNEFVKMDKNSSKLADVMESLSHSKDYKYIKSREEYLKFIAFGRYLRQWSIEKKSENGTLTQNDIDNLENIKSSNKTYAEYREWKKTKEAKERWEANVGNGVLKLYVEDGANMTKKEKNRFDALMKQLETDAYYKKLVVADESTLLILDAPNKSKTEIVEVQEINESVEVPFSVVEEVPTLKECKDLPTNKERKNCMSSFVNKHVGKNFNTKLSDSLNPGKKRIFVFFKIDKEGNVKDIKARAPSEALEEEAKRVLKLLPQFVPGKQKGKLVTVPYSLPIVFEVKGDDKNTNTPYYERFKDSLMDNEKLSKLISQRDRLLKNSSDKNPVVVQLNKQIDDLKGSLQKQSDSLYLDKIETQEETRIIETLEDNLEEVPSSEVDESPVHPDCNNLSSESDKKSCTTRSVNKHLGKNFNSNLAKSLDLPAGKKRISAQFVINKKGNVTKIKVEGPHPKLEEEVERVLKLLPQFIPGKKDGKVVNVPFSIPIVFSVADIKKD